MARILAAALVLAACAPAPVARDTLAPLASPRPEPRPEGL
jgi:hypothetical protein